MLFPTENVNCWTYDGSLVTGYTNAFASLVSGASHYCRLDKSVSCQASNNNYGQADVPSALQQF